VKGQKGFAFIISEAAAYRQDVIWM